MAEKWLDYQAPRSLTLFRKGQTDWHVGGAFHCGTDAALHKDGHLGIEWEVEVKAAPKLDTHGFLFDQTSVADTIAQIAKSPTGLSCERLAEWVGHVLRSRIKLEDPAVVIQDMRVRLSPEPYVAYIEAHWVAGP